MSAQFKAAMVKLSYNLHNCEINDSFHVHHGATGRNGYGANAFVPKRPDKSILEQFQKIIGLAQGVKRCEEDPVVLMLKKRSASPKSPEKTSDILQKWLQDHGRAVASEGENDAKHTPDTFAGPDSILAIAIATIKSRNNIAREGEGTVKPPLSTPKPQSALGRLAIDGSVGIDFEDTVGVVTETAPVKPPKTTGRPRSIIEYLNPVPFASQMASPDMELCGQQLSKSFSMGLGARVTGCQTVNLRHSEA